MARQCRNKFCYFLASICFSLKDAFTAPIVKLVIKTNPGLLIFAVLYVLQISEFALKVGLLISLCCSQSR